jgi:glycosyltransferase involved in cell wall biosynthesis
MRIAIDATAIPSQRVGAGNYIFNLTRSLAELLPPDELVVFARSEDIRPISNIQLINTPHSSRIRRILWEQFSLCAQLRDLSIDVLHSPHYTMPLRSECASVVTFHDMTFFMYPEMYQFYRKFFFRTMIRRSAQRAQAIIAVSESTRRDILRLLKTDPAKVFTVHLGVAPHFRPLDDPAALEELWRSYHLPKRFILYVGELEPRKNVPALVQAFKSLVDQSLPHALVIVGPKGGMYDRLLRTIASLGLTDRIIFTGYVPEDELPLFYNAAELFAFPSIYEGFGLPVLEAMACGAPVVTSNVSSLPEIVGDAGILVDPRNVSALADAMLRVLKGGDLRRDLSRRGRERAALFSWRRTAQETLTVYSSALRRAAGG